MYTFGEIHPGHGGEKIGVGVSPDRRAVTLTFSDLQVTVGGKLPVPVSTRTFNLLMPLKGSGKKAEIEFIVQGYILAHEGATASLVCSVNGQTTVVDFPGSADQTIQQTLKFTAPAPSECRLCVFLVMGRDSKNLDANAYLNVTSIDAEILPRPQPAA